MEEIEFRALCLENLDEIIEMRVRPDQQGLVADNLYSVAQACLDPLGECRAAYVDDKPIGFYYIRTISEAHLYICRFMIDYRWQGRGLGRQVLLKLLASAFSSPQLELIDLAVSREPGGAEGFYRRAGFISREEKYRGGWRMVLTRSRYLEHNINAENLATGGKSADVRASVTFW